MRQVHSKCILGMALLLLLEPVADAREGGDRPGSPKPAFVRVWLLALDAPTEALNDGPISVRIGLGGSRMFESDLRHGDNARWKHSIRLGTRKALPVTFDVVAHDPAEGPPRRLPQTMSGDLVGAGRRSLPGKRTLDEDAVLATGFDDLVGDFVGDDGRREKRKADTGIKSQKARGLPAVPAGSGRVLCRASLKWPPGNGTHRLACGKAHLVVRIKGE
jgi:hypothetical protein